MKSRERLLELARKEFDAAANAGEPALMKVHAEMANYYLTQAETATGQEKKEENGQHSTKDRAP